MSTQNIKGLSQLENDDEFIEDLVLQRTGEFVNLPGGREKLNEWFSSGIKKQLAAHLRKLNKVKWFLDKTLEYAESDADQIACATDERRPRIASIGPGNGFVEKYLIQRVLCDRLLLIDIESSQEHHHGYNENGSGYASLEKTRKFLELNAERTVEILLCNPKKSPLPHMEYDLAISILSMGFHYPTDYYAEWLIENAAPSAQLIIDKRKGVVDAGFARLLEAFDAEVVSENAKSARLKLKKRWGNEP